MNGRDLDQWLGATGMKIIYNCYGGSHSSVTAAAIHLGLVNSEQTPGARDLWKLPYYDAQVKKDHGTLFFMGTDQLGHQVYVAGRRNMARPMLRAMRGIAQVFGIPEEDFQLVDPMPYVNPAMVVGGITSRRLGLAALGKPIVTWGTRLAFPQLAKLVSRVKSRLEAAKRIDFTPAVKKVVVYCDYTGGQQAAYAAARHLGKDWRKLSYGHAPAGTLRFWGKDSGGHEVYSLGVLYENELIIKLVREFARLYAIPDGNLILTDLTPLDRVSFGVGAVLERMSPLRWLGQIWTNFSVAQRADRIDQVVRGVKEQLADSAAKVSRPEDHEFSPSPTRLMH